MKPPVQTADGVEGAKSLAVMQGWTAALMSGRAKDVEDQFWAEDAVVIVPDCLPYGGTYTRDRFGEYRANMFGAWEVKPLPPSLYAAGNKVFLIGNWTGKARATGKPVDMALIEIFTIGDGKIIRDEFFFGDTHALVEALAE
jgi:ketosteroid isomerase-like protein